MLIQYNYHPVTGEYISAEPAQKDPREKDKYLLPANATFIKPDKVAAEREALVFDKIEGEWKVVKDDRGLTFYHKTARAPYTVTKLGEVPDLADYTLKKPDYSVDQVYDEETQEWVLLKPLAMGRDIVTEAQKTFVDADFALRGILLNTFNNFPVPKDLLPKLSGRDGQLIEGIAKLTAGEVVYLNLQALLESATCNPMKRIDFNALMHCLEFLPDDLGELKATYQALAQGFANKVRFEGEER